MQFKDVAYLMKTNKMQKFTFTVDIDPRIVTLLRDFMEKALVGERGVEHYEGELADLLKVCGWEEWKNFAVGVVLRRLGGGEV